MLSVLALAACSVSAPARTVSRAVPPVCVTVLSWLPPSPPATGQEAADDEIALSGRKGTTAGSLSGAVASDSAGIGLDLADGHPAARDVARWKADAKALRSYCG